ncbi:mevalonate kinase [Patescibacteria group bacterium]
MKKVSVSAPGKLMLLGEHAVVYDRPCIVTAVDQRLIVKIEKTSKGRFEFESSDVNISNHSKYLTEIGTGEIPRGAKFVELAIKNTYDKFGLKEGLKIKTKSEFSPLYGFGSSSASTVSVIKGLSELFKLRLSDRDIFDLAYKTILDVQKIGSGFDIAAAIWGGTIFFTKGAEIVEPLISETQSEYVIGYSGVKADTASLVRDIKNKLDNNQKKVNRIFDAIAKIVNEAKERFVEGDWERVGKLMNFNQEYLRNLGVSTQKIEDMIYAAKKAGAYGAKLSGAGGGDCMIAIVGSKVKKKVESAITAAGGEVMDIKISAPGVRVETSDDPKELFIVINEDDKVLDFKTRYDCHHDKSFIHRTVGILIYNQKGELLLQKRSSTKDMDSGLWAISAAGHVIKGQTYDEAMRRELKEELGISIPIKRIKKFISKSKNETEMAVLYEGYSDGPFKINPEETEKIEFYSLRKLKFFVESNILKIAPDSVNTLKEAEII